MYKFLGLSSMDRHLLVQSAFLLLAIRLGLWLFPFQTLQRALARITQPTAKLQEIDQASVNRVVWAVAIASRYIPGVKCLAQALATQVLLQQRGFPARLRIGLAKGEQGQLEGHAWVESQGQVVIGQESALERFTLVSAFE